MTSLNDEEDAGNHLIARAREIAAGLGHPQVDTGELLIALTEASEGPAAEALQAQGLTPETVRRRVVEESGIEAAVDPARIDLSPGVQALWGRALEEAASSTEQAPAELAQIVLRLLQMDTGLASQILAEVQAVGSGPGVGDGMELPGGLGPFLSDLTAIYAAGKADPVIGRQLESERVAEILSRRGGHCVALISDAPSNQGDVVRAFAQDVVMHDSIVPPETRVLALQAALLEAVDAVETIRSIIGFARTADAILFIDDITVVSDGVRLNEYVTRALQQAVETHGLRVIVGVTPEEYDALVRKSRELAALFEAVDVSEPSVAVTYQMLRGARDKLEAHHRLTVEDDALVAAAELADQFISDRYLPESAVQVIDDACAQVRQSSTRKPPEIAELEAAIEAVRLRKEDAVDSHDFETAARLRDDERKLTSRRDDLEREAAGRFGHIARVVDARAVVRAVAHRTGKTEAMLDQALERASQNAVLAVREPSSPSSTDRADPFRLLNDEPLLDLGHDFLGVSTAATRIAALLRSAPTPFVFALDGSWGRGKSTMLRQIQKALPEEAKILQFNAWTAQGDNALESLMKSVLRELDPRLLRRWASQAAKKGHLIAIVAIFVGVLGRFFGITRLIDILWEQMGGDEGSRNQLRSNVQGLLNEWVAGTPSGAPRRQLFILIDDLDRCSDQVVIQVCEAVKLYLDAPGLTFVLACDMGVLARSAAKAARGGEGEGAIYLEKIVQASFPLPAIPVAGMAELIRHLAVESGTSELLRGSVESVLLERADGNPRRIKRIINSFVLESETSDAWHKAPLGSGQLMRVVLLQHFYPRFLAYAKESRSDDPMGDFLEFVEFRRRVGDPPGPTDRWWSVSARLLRRNRLPVPNRKTATVSELSVLLERLISLMPTDVAALTADEPFVALLQGFGDADSRRAVRVQLTERPLFDAAPLGLGDDGSTYSQLDGSSVPPESQAGQGATIRAHGDPVSGAS